MHKHDYSGPADVRKPMLLFICTNRPNPAILSSESVRPYELAEIKILAPFFSFRSPGSWLRIMNTLITGGAGFIGSHLAEYLLDQGHRVFVIDDLSTGNIENILPLKTNSNFPLHHRHHHERSRDGGTGGSL